MSQPLRKTLKGGHDPAEAGRKGGIARSRSLSPERASEIGRQAQLALQLKHKRQLLSLVGPALDGLEEALKLARGSKGIPGDPTALVRVVTAILDRTGFHGKSGIELEGDISHSGEIVHRHQLLDPEKLPPVVRQMILASIDAGWEPSEDLTETIWSELPVITIPSKNK